MKADPVIDRALQALDELQARREQARVEGLLPVSETAPTPVAASPAQTNGGAKSTTPGTACSAGGAQRWKPDCAISASVSRRSAADPFTVRAASRGRGLASQTQPPLTAMHLKYSSTDCEPGCGSRSR